MTDAPVGLTPPALSQLTQGRWTTLEPLVDAALDLPPEQRQHFLDQACAGDATLRAHLDRLLRPYDRQDTLLDHAAAERFSSLLDDEAPPPAVPAVLGERYRIDGEIGRGGMATVYVAHDVRHDRRVAVKVLHAELSAAVGAERFLAEIKTTARLQHPHILPLHDSGEADGLLFYVMPYVEGESLRQRMSREHQLPIDDAVRIACEVASALDAAHRQGVIHRDIKPENILLLNGSALVADFGIALALSSQAAPRLTGSGLTIGTPQYMSPEQATGERALDGRSDTYSLGIVLFEMLAGERPFTGPTTAAIVAKLLSVPAPSLRIVRAAIPEALDAAVLRALAREPADRYRTAGEFADALQQSLVPRVSGAQPQHPARRSAGRRFALSLLGLLAVSLAGFAVMQRVRNVASRQDRVVAGEAVKSIAVLPLTIIGTDTADRYFAESMTDELSGALGTVAGLRVVPGRSAASLFNGKDPDFRDLGLKLGVTTLLQGRARQEGRQRKVTIELVSTRDGSMLWTRSYSRDIYAAKDIYAVRDTIVKDIVAQLRVKLASAAAVSPLRHPTENLEAYDRYHRGVFFSSRMGPDGSLKALQYFREAIAIDSTFAEAWSGLAGVYTWYGISDFSDYSPTEYFPKARAAAQRALALDSTSAEAHTQLAYANLLYDYDWVGAEREMARALELDPRSSTAHRYRGVLFYFTGRFDEAVADMRAGVQDEPLNLRTGSELGRALFFAKRYDEAIVALSQTLERDSTQYRSHLLLGQVLEQKGMPDSAVAEMRRAVRYAPNSSRARAFLAHAYARAGRTTEALRELAALQQRARGGGYVPSFDFAIVYAGLGRKDGTFAWLGKSVDDHSMRPYLMDPTFDPIRSDARYQKLLRRMHHPLATAAR